MTTTNTTVTVNVNRRGGRRQSTVSPALKLEVTTYATPEEVTYAVNETKSQLPSRFFSYVEKSISDEKSTVWFLKPIESYFDTERKEFFMLGTEERAIAYKNKSGNTVHILPDCILEGKFSEKLLLGAFAENDRNQEIDFLVTLDPTLDTQLIRVKAYGCYLCSEEGKECSEMEFSFFTGTDKEGFSYQYQDTLNLKDLVYKLNRVTEDELEEKEEARKKEILQAEVEKELIFLQKEIGEIPGLKLFFYSSREGFLSTAPNKKELYACGKINFPMYTVKLEGLWKENLEEAFIKASLDNKAKKIKCYL